MCRSVGGINFPTRTGIPARIWWVSHVPEKIPHFIHVPPTAADSDDDDPPSITHFDGDDTAGQNTTVSDFCDRIDHPVVDD